MQKLRVIEQPKSQPQLSRHLPIENFQPGAVGQFDDGGVEHHVGGADGDPVFVGAGVDAGFDGFAHVQGAGVFGVALGEGFAFDEAAYAVDVDDRGHVGFGHGDAAVGFVFEQAFAGEDAEGFAQGVARDVEAVGQGGFGQALAWNEFALDQHSADFVGDGGPQCARQGGRSVVHKASMGGKDRVDIPTEAAVSHKDDAPGVHH